ncbi:MAG: hypothetical protein RIQ54_63 [Candidatus Parcubacteria bacterium]|jgi:hypothetical protein
MTIFLLAWALVATILLVLVSYLHFVSNPLPFPDRGHRCYGVRDAKAQEILVRLLHTFGLKEVFTMDAGPSHQTIMNDGSTVIHYLDSNERAELFTGTALSIRFDDPLKMAKLFREAFTSVGYASRIYEPTLSGLPPGSLYILVSEAFLGWELVITKPIMQMPMPNKRKIILS